MGRSRSTTRDWMLYDAIVMALCFIVVYVFAVRPEHAGLSKFFFMRVSIVNIMTFGALVLLWHALFSSMRVYGQTSLAGKCSYSSTEVMRIMKASAVGSLTIVVMSMIANIKFVGAEFLLLFFVSVTSLTVLGRYVFREIFLRFLDDDDRLLRLLVVGANRRSLKLANQIRSSREMGYRIIGFADQSVKHVDDFDQSGYDVVSDLENLPQYLRSTPVDEVVITLPLRTRYDDIERVARLCDEQGITVGMLPDMIAFNPMFSGLQSFGDQTIMTVGPHGIKGVQAFIKRLLDVVASSALLVLLVPVFILIMAAIKLTSRGPVFFRQERLGLNKKRFKMLKFRSMVVDAEDRMAAIEGLNEAEGPVFKIEDDPRITKIGKFLRKSSLDELPQLFNVLRGEMSLVGPRPLTVRDYEGFSEDWHRRRFSIRPGITGLWQVSGRCDLPFDQWMQLDMQYIDQWSLALDIKVLLLTVPAVVSGSGAK